MDLALNNLQKLICYKTQKIDQQEGLTKICAKNPEKIFAIFEQIGLVSLFHGITTFWVI